MEYSVAQIVVPKSGAIVAVRHALPGNAGRCLSVAFSATVESPDKALAAAGISFNGGKDQTINRFVFSKPSYPRVAGGVNVNQKVLQGADVVGYVEDLQVSESYPYTVKIYFELV